MRAFLVLAVSFATPCAAREQGLPQQQVAAPSAKPVCEDHAVMAASKGKAIGVRPLGQEPNARQLLAVVRIVGGCSKPVVIREQIGFNGR